MANTPNPESYYMLQKAKNTFFMFPFDVFHIQSYYAECCISLDPSNHKVSFFIIASKLYGYRVLEGFHSLLKQKMF